MTGVCVCGHYQEHHDKETGRCTDGKCECMVFRDNDVVAHPPQYAEGREFEPIDVINDWKLNFNLGNVLKYIARCDKKGTPVIDLKKARFYLDDEIKRREQRE